jgi:hypothetical protein
MVWWKIDAKNDHFKTEEIIKSYGLMAPKRYSNLKKLTNSFKEEGGQGRIRCCIQRETTLWAYGGNENA